MPTRYLLLRLPNILISVVLGTTAVAVAADLPTAEPVLAETADASEEEVLTAQEQAAEDIFTAQPTGDALWDKYAEAILWMPWWAGIHTYLPDPTGDPQQALAAELAAAEDDQDRAEAYLNYAELENPPRLPDEVLALWEPQFGKDPRYWQLRYWNAWQYNDKFEQGDPNPLRFLKEGRAKGVTDAATDWILLHEDIRGLPDGETNEQFEAKYQAMLELLAVFIANHPQESIGWYKRALLLADYGSFENCLADLAAGKAATRNRELHLFPYSFVMERVATGQAVGSPVVAGAVIQAGAMVQPLQNPIRLAEFFKNAQVVLAISGDEDTLAPLFSFAVRLAQRKGASDTTRLAGTSAISNLAILLIVESHQGRNQRAALMRLRDRTRSVSQNLNSYFMGDWNMPRFRDEYLPRQMAKEMLALGVSYEDLAAATVVPLDFGIDFSPGRQELMNSLGDWPELDMTSPVWPLHALTARMMAPLLHYKVIYDWAVERRGRGALEKLGDLEKIARFDMATLSWPEDDPDAGA